MTKHWAKVAWICVLVLTGCGGKAVNWLAQPTSLEQEIQERRDARTTYKPIVESNVDQRLKWREERSKKFHKMRQVYNPEYQDYSYLCLTGHTLTVYLKQEKQIRREKINRPNKQRVRSLVNR